MTDIFTHTHLAVTCHPVDQPWSGKYYYTVTMWGKVHVARCNRAELVHYMGQFSLTAEKEIPEPLPIGSSPVTIRLIPTGMVLNPPYPCDFAAGDPVVYTNDYGVQFDRVVIGFAEKDHLRGHFVYLDSDCWWFPVKPSSLRHRDA